jgi:mRNA interferase RelE/StbE
MSYNERVAWTILYSRSSLRSLRKMPRNLAQTIQKKISSLALDPHAPNNNATKLQGRDGYRLRIGDWRVLCELGDNRITVLDIKPRGGVYH